MQGKLYLSYRWFLFYFLITPLASFCFVPHLALLSVLFWLNTFQIFSFHTTPSILFLLLHQAPEECWHPCFWVSYLWTFKGHNKDALHPPYPTYAYWSAFTAHSKLCLEAICFQRPIWSSMQLSYPCLRKKKKKKKKLPLTQGQKEQLLRRHL